MEKWSVGDWIYLFDPADKEESKQVQKISEVREDGIKVSAYNDIFEDIWFEPIPITSEVLEKNGLMRMTEEKYCEEYWCNDFSIRRSKFSDTDWWQVDVHYKQYVAHLSGYIQYIHQLQHLLTINECDKKIEL